MKLYNPDGPKTKKELWEYLQQCIDQEGFHYALESYTSPDYCNCTTLDPDLAKLWNAYLKLAQEIEKHIGVETW